MIKNHLEQAVNYIEAEREQAISIATQKVTQNVIIPHNQEINKLRDNAITEIEAEYNKKKQELIDKGEADKKNFADATINLEVAKVTKVYDENIAKLKEQIETLEE